MPDTHLSERRGQLVRLQDRMRRASGRRGVDPPVADLSRYQANEDHEDYRHRMLTNVAAAVVIVILVGTGIWLAESMAALRKNQDCAMAGRRNCVPLEVPIQPRW